MKVVIMGGSGRVGGCLLPFLAQRLTLRVFDLVPPGEDGVEYMPGDVTDPRAVGKAVEGMDAVVYMVMPALSHFRDVTRSHDLNVKGLHLTLAAAREAGIRRAVYASTGDVHGNAPGGYPSEDIPHDPVDVYGFTKALGEHVCQWMCQVSDMTIVMLRLFRPVPREEWLGAPDKRGFHHGPCATSASDAANAFVAALTKDLSGLHTVFISGDHEGKIVNITRARTLLGWAPLDRRPERSNPDEVS